MKKIFDKAASWLAHFGAGRYLHLIAGIVITIVVGSIMNIPAWQSGLVGFAVAAFLGWVKEIVDAWTDGYGDIVDWLFTIIGGAIGYGLLMLTTIWG